MRCVWTGLCLILGQHLEPEQGVSSMADNTVSCCAYHDMFVRAKLCWTLPASLYDVSRNTMQQCLLQWDLSAVIRRPGLVQHGIKLETKKVPAEGVSQRFKESLLLVTRQSAVL